uniref:hypothetical protein n=1 Tax=Rhodococcus qingshengii TaxID=334542 RepID=UPI001C4E2ACC|nr:hypothetical protein [Rhodococcus qingshengii]
MTAEAVETTTDPETPVVEETPKVEPATPEVDEPVRKLRLLDWKLHIPWIDLRVPYWCIWIAALFLGLLLGWSFSDGWGASQWGPLAAWFGGILTATAVGVSLWQANEAKKKSVEDAERASKLLKREKKRNKKAEAAEVGRHEQALTNANNRLKHEIDSQRRHQQLMSIPPIWEAIGELAAPTKYLLYALQVGSVGDEAAREKARDMYSSWEILYDRAQISFTTATLIISDAEVSKHLKNTYKELMAFKVAMLAVHSQFIKKEKITIEEGLAARDRLSSIIAERNSMIECAALNIGGLMEIDENTKQTDPDSSS